MNENLIGVLREVRTSLQIIAEPIDWFVARWMNNKKGYPPMWLRQKVGDLNDFEGSGGEYIAYLKLLCNLKRGDTLLDLGCGCGLVCLQINENASIPEYLGSDGRYVGLDIDKKLVDWCDRNIKRRYPNCQFTTSLDGLYNYKFDVVLAKSLFTHLYLEEAERYFKEISRLLRPNGKCLATFFLRRESDRLTGRYTFRFPSINGHVLYERGSNPTLAVAYDAELFPGLVKLSGLQIEEVHYGSWRGDGKGLSFQDIVILRGLHR